MIKVDLNFIDPEETSVVVDGVEYILKPITMRDLPALIRCVEPVLADLLVLAQAPSMEGALSILGARGDLVCEAVAICLGKDADDIRAMTPDRVAALALVCCEVNVDFFARAVPSIKSQASSAAPQIFDLIGSLPRQPISAGLMPSTSSPAPGTSTATS